MNFKILFITYLITVLRNFTVIHAGTFLMKIKSVTKLGVLLSPIFFTVEKVSIFIATWTKIQIWLFDNSTYIQLVLGAVALDHFLGTVKHLWWTYDFQFKKNLIGLAVKIGLVVIVGFLFEGLNELIRQDSIIKDYLTDTTRIIVFLYPAGSAFSSSSVISGGKFPPVGWMEKLKRYQKNLDKNEFKQPNKN